jgi:hypothetical protein
MKICLERIRATGSLANCPQHLLRFQNIAPQAVGTQYRCLTGGAALDLKTNLPSVDLRHNEGPDPFRQLENPLFRKRPNGD